MQGINTNLVKNWIQILFLNCRLSFGLFPWIRDQITEHKKIKAKYQKAKYEITGAVPLYKLAKNK